MKQKLALYRSIANFYYWFYFPSYRPKENYCGRISWYEQSVRHYKSCNSFKNTKKNGLSPSVLQWFESYLSQRYQVVRINSVLSVKLSAASGVPQGSVLGALLSSIYVNYLPNVSQNCSTACYVDDTKLLMSLTVNDSAWITESVNSDLQRFRNWRFDNCLMLNPDKTKLMVFCSRGMSSKLLDFKLSPLGKDINPAQSVKDFGVISDPTLSFDNHISILISSCMSKLSQISRIRFVFDKQLLETITNALVFSKLYYCSSVWSSSRWLPVKNKIVLPRCSFNI